jgi:hypothetical protein
MTVNAGVWIDHDRAVVVLLTEQGQEMLQISSSDDPAARTTAALRTKNFSSQDDFLGETKGEKAASIRLNHLYDEVIACVRDAQAILILGPGAAMGEFRRRIARQKLGSHVAEMRTVARLTDDQIADYVRQHFQ